MVSAITGAVNRVAKATDKRELLILMRHAEIDSIKAFAIVGVVIAHMSFDSRLDISTLEIIHTLQLIFGWCVIAFFFCSGLLAKPIVNKPDILSFVKKRFIRLVLPCVVFSLTYKILLTAIFLTGKVSWVSPIPSSISEAISFIYTPVGPQFYFLYYLYAISVGVALLTWLTSFYTLVILAMVTLPTIYLISDIPTSGYGSAWTLIPIYAFSYITGYALSTITTINNGNPSIHRSIHSKYQALNQRSIFCVLLIPVAATLVLSQNWVIVYIFIPLGLWKIFRQFPTLTKIINKTQIGTQASAIYVWHAPLVLPIISIVGVKIFGDGPVVIGMMLFFTIIVSFLLQKIVAKHQFLRIWQI